MKVVYLYNSGVLLSYNGEAIIVDGIFDDNNSFDKMSSEYKEALMNKESPFNDINAMLFTHCHDDHYSEEVAILFSEKYEDTKIIAPINGRDSMLSGEFGEFFIGDFKIEYLKTKHIYVGPLTCDNYVYKVTTGNKTVVITGDTEPESLSRIIEVFGCDADMFLINAATFLYNMKQSEGSVFKQIDNLYVYHLPTEKNDVYMYRKATIRMIKKAETYLNNITYLLDNMKSIY